MISNYSGYLMLLAIMCIAFALVAIAQHSSIRASIPLNSAVYDLHHNNYYDSNILQRVSVENGEEIGSGGICNRYLETCPTPGATQSPPASETVEDTGQSFRERYLEQPGSDSVDATNATTEPGQARFVVYNNDAEKIRIQYPSNWQIAERNKANPSYPAVVTFYSPYESDSDPYVEVVDVTTQNLSPQDRTITPQQYLARVISSYRQQSPDSRVIEVNPNVPFGSKGLPGYKLVFTITDKSVDDSDTTLKVTETGTIDNQAGKVYFVRSFVQDNKSPNYLPVTEKMANSFELLK